MQARGIKDAFSMAAFLAFLELRSFRAEHPCLTDAEVVASLNRVRTSAIGLDFRGGIALLRRLDSSLDWKQTKEHLRLFVYEWVRLVEPRWLRLVPYGREKLRNALGRDQVQCFREAGLFDADPDKKVVEWWDCMAALMRGASDAEKMKRARLAERLSLEHERMRLKGLGISEEPRWVALEDNTLGYDILSYDFDSEGRIVSRLVEVKSKLSDTIFLTRNEWENAFGAAQRTVIHVWDLPQERLREYRTSEMAPNIPLDQGTGTWQHVRITLESSM